MLKKYETSAFANVPACADVKGIANKSLEKTSMPDKTYLKTGDWNGPTKSICIISPGKSCSDDMGCKGGFNCRSETLFRVEHDGQFLM